MHVDDGASRPFLDGGGGSSSLSTSLSAMRDFAVRLDEQRDALRTPRDTTAAIAARPVHLGSFGEADRLRLRHQAGALLAQQAVDGIDEVLRFAEAVTQLMADTYEKGDEQARSQIRSGIQRNL